MSFSNAAIPHDFTCPITLELFNDPVILAQSGNSYKRQALKAALDERPNVDPKTNATFEGSATIVPNHTLRGSIDEWKEIASGVATNLRSLRTNSHQRYDSLREVRDQRPKLHSRGA